MGIVEVLEISGGRSPLIIEVLDAYPSLPRSSGAPTLNSEEPEKRIVKTFGVYRVTHQKNVLDGRSWTIREQLRIAMVVWIARGLVILVAIYAG